jgi:uncharacterized membrane protein YeaQ/YmgE (transglycosylase-associated protein family)
MRYFAGFVLVLALMPLPLGASAQDADVAGTSQHEPEESAPSDERVGDEGTLSPRVRKRARQQWDPETYKLRLDSSGLSLSPPPAPRQKTDAQVRQYRKGVIVSSVVLGIGGALIGSGVVVLRNWQEEQESQEPMLEFSVPGGAIVLFALGTVAALGGLIGAAASGSNLGTRKRELRERQAAHRGKPPRVQWDLAQSRLVF